jgi:putative endonuclease
MRAANATNLDRNPGERSGGICGSPNQQPVQTKAWAYPLSSRPERSVVEGSAVTLPTRNLAMGKREHHYYVYIVASRTHVLYCGITNSLQRRVTEHRDAAMPGFTETYQCNRLVWFEHYQYVGNALDREKQIKRWRRAKKIWLIEQMNPTWADLSEASRNETADPSTPLRSGRDDKG